MIQKNFIKLSRRVLPAILICRPRRIHEQARADQGGSELGALMEANRIELNKHLASFETLQKIRMHNTEFEKTPKRSIKRFLYKLS